ncbi:MAG: peptidoglycan binding domain-containing protein [bacterium]|nr:peptidoglycan binding domain-containing protein [bacterium]
MSSKAKQTNTMHYVKITAGILISVFLLVLSSFPVAYAYYFKTRFFPNTVVAGVDVSRMELAQAKEILQKKFGSDDQKKLFLTLADKEYTFNFEQLGISFQWREVLNDTFQNQRNRSIIKDGLYLARDIITQKKTIKPAILTIQKEKINSNLSQILGEVNKNPVDASIAVSGDQLVINKEEYGVGIDKIVLEKMLYSSLNQKALDSNWKELHLTFQASSLEPSNKEADLGAIKTQAEGMIKSPIYLVFEDKKYTFSANRMIKWLKFETKAGTVTPSIDQAAVTKDITSIAKKIDIKPVEKRISSIDGSIMQEGKDGRSLARTKLASDILAIFTPTPTQASNNSPNNSILDQSIAIPSANAFSENRTIAMQVDTKPFATKTMAPPFTPGMYPGKYIEMNLSNQTMYLWEGQNKVKEFRISSGKRSTPTREGVFKIKNKAPKPKSFPWIMPWWMAFAQDRTGAWQGIHELPVDMRTGYKEGIGDIGYAVSHGCVRLSVGPAQEVYNWAEVGIPVYIHK